MRRGWAIVLWGAVSMLAVAKPARALESGDVGGHMTLGFSHLFVSDTSSTPGGSLSFGAGIDIPLSPRLRTGLGLGYHMLGSRTLVQGSLSSGIDYSVFEVTALVHWSPLDHGPDLVLSAGPGLFRTQAELAATSTGLAFTAYGVDGTHVGAAFNVAALRRKVSPVRAGLELGLRIIPLEDVTWMVANVGIAIRY